MNQNNQPNNENLLNKVVTVTTDFGTTDGYTGIVKGVIKSIAPQACLIDITSEIAPADIESAAWILHNAYRFFAANTVHLAVIDPGVGSERRSIIITTARGTFVGPDNGIFSLIVRDEKDARAFLIENYKYCLPEVSSSFHARDVYGPVAAHLANGVPASDIAREVEIAQLVALPDKQLAFTETRISGEVVYIDRFGNLITNIPNRYVAEGKQCYLGEKQLCAVGRTYSTAQIGEATSFAGSHGCLEIGIFQGNASKVLNAERRTPVSLESAT